MTHEKQLNTAFAPTQLSSVILDDNAPADGHSKISIFYSLTDANGNPAPGEYLRFSLQGTSSAILDSTIAPTTAAGQFLLGVSNNESQSVTVRAEVLSNSSIYNTSQITFGGQSIVLLAETLADNVPADGISQNRVLFTLKNPITNARYPNVYLDIESSNGAQPEEYVEKTDENGYVELLLTNTTPGNVWIDARSQAPFAAETAHVVTFKEGIVQPHYILTSSQVSGTADGVTRSQLPFTLINNVTGLPVPGMSIVFTVQSGYGVLDSNAALTGSDGVAYALVSSTLENNVVVQGQLMNNPAVSSSGAVEFSASVLPYNLNAVPQGDNNPVTALILVDFTLRNTITGAPVVGQRIEYEVLSGAASTFTSLPPYGTTNSSGVVVGAFQSNGIAGTSVVRGFLASDPSVSVTQSITFVAAAPEYTLSYEVLRNNAPADGVTPNQVRYTLRNIQTSQPVSNQFLTFTTNGQGTVSPSSAYSDANGQVTVSMTSSVVQGVQLIATLQSSSDVKAIVPLMFSDEYPKSIVYDLTISGLAGIGRLTDSRDMLIGHRYTIEELDSNFMQKNECVPLTHFIQQTWSCDFSQTPDVVELENTSVLIDFISLRTGNSADFISKAYVSVSGPDKLIRMRLTDYGPDNIIKAI